MSTPLLQESSERNPEPPVKGPRRKTSALSLAAGALIGLVALVFVAIVYISPLFVEPFRNDAAVADGGSVEQNLTPSERATVTLSGEKLASAGIQDEPVTRRTLTHVHSVPGRIVYNDNRHIEVTAPTDGILTELRVKPGDAVEAQQVLASLNSPEIGTARANVMQSEAQAALTERLAERERTREQNVTALTDALKTQPDFDKLRQQFSGKTLGDYREKLFAAYSQTQLAELLGKSATGLSGSGALPGKTMLERQAAARSARAALEAACEQAVLDVWQRRSEAEAAAQDARRRSEIARQHLASLLLNDSAIHADVDMPGSSDLGASDNDLAHLSRVAVRAPFAGTIESRTFSATERVHAADSMFVLADTTTLWITAEIRENDWPAVAVEPGQVLSVVVPALGDAALQATVEFVGREVSPETNAIPIVAVVDNSTGRLRPGLFVRVTVPVGSKPDALTVPALSVLQHDGVSFVFVRQNENRFCRVDVVTGDTADGRVEVVTGLKLADRVVTRGAFVLKSELLLEAEEE